MKLKKIASLMLAGIMAVSMLAGCNGSTTTDDNKEPEESVASDIVGAVEGALKLDNSGLVITVKENQVMGDALQKEVFDKQVANDIDTKDDSEILTVLNSVFTATAANGGINKIAVGDDFIANKVKWLNADGSKDSDSATRKAGEKYYAYTVITSGEHYGYNFDIHAANEISDALAKLENSFRVSDDVVLDADYTMYLYRVDDKNSSEKDVPFLVAVIEANYKDSLN